MLEEEAVEEAGRRIAAVVIVILATMHTPILDHAPNSVQNNPHSTLMQKRSLEETWAEKVLTERKAAKVAQNVDGWRTPWPQFSARPIDGAASTSAK